jgi:hypothetical protein
MEYQVPQFIEVEDRIFGPFTLKQFIYIGGGVGLSVVLFLYVKPLFLALILIAPVAALAGSLAFLKINSKPFIEVLEAGFNYYTKGRLYLWKKEQPKAEAAAPAPEAVEVRQKLTMNQGKLHDLALSLDIKDQNQPPAAP